MIWGATAVLAEAYDGLNQLTMATMVTRRPLPAQFLERQLEMLQ